MILRVFGANFKGRGTFDQPLGVHTLFIGPNGSGKSTRPEALALAILEYLPGKPKTSQGILSTFSDQDEMVVGFEIENEGEFLKRLKKSPKTGGVSATYKLNGKAVNKNVFSKALGAAGNPLVFDLKSFMDKSDAGKLKMIFDLFPPEGDLVSIEGKISDAKEYQNRLETGRSQTEGAIQKLLKAKSEIEVPAGTLPESKARIESLEEELGVAKNNLQAFDQAEADRVAAEKQAVADAEAAKRQAAADLLVAKGQDDAAAQYGQNMAGGGGLADAIKTHPDPVFLSRPDVSGPVGPGASFPEQKPSAHSLVDTTRCTFPGKVTYPEVKETLLPPAFTEEDVELSIRKIIEAMDAAGCTTCTAKMIAGVEMRKYMAKGGGSDG